MTQNLRYFVYLSYNGTNYHGWQIQPNALSVQETLEKALSTVLRRTIEVVGAGRTDAGVHAEMMTAHFDVTEMIPDTQRLLASLNSLLPADIAVHRILPVKSDAHARFDALSRRYEYRITMNKNPFRQDTLCRLFNEPDFELMNQAAQKLFNYTDFTSFSKLHTDVKTNNCKIIKAGWIKSADGWTFIIEADRFLRNMVRAIVGTLLEVGRGKITVNDFCAIIENKDRSKAGTSAPAHGLFLVNVTYPDHLFI